LGATGADPRQVAVGRAMAVGGVDLRRSDNVSRRGMEEEEEAEEEAAEAEAFTGGGCCRSFVLSDAGHVEP